MSDSWQGIPREKALHWVGSAKPWKGDGPGVLEIVEDHRGDTYRAVCDVKLIGQRLKRAQQDT